MRCSSTAKTSSPTTVATPPACRVTSRRAADHDRDASSSSSQPMIERRPDHSRAPPPSSQKQRGCARGHGAEERSAGSLGVQEQEVPDERLAVLRQDRLGVELHALERQRGVAHAHHDTVLAPRGRDELVGQRDGAERVVADGGEALRQPGEDARAVVPDRRDLAVRRGQPLAPCRRTPSPVPACPGRRRARGGCRPAAPPGPPRSPSATTGGRGPATARRASGASTSSAVTSSCCTTRGRTPVTRATRCTRFHV